MTTDGGSLALIQYECERCQRGFVPPSSSPHLGFAGGLQALRAGLGRTFRGPQDLGQTLGEARRQLVVKANDEAYRSYAQSVHLCPACRQFVCHECWATSRGTCQLCATGGTSGAARPVRPLVPVVGLGIVRPVVSAAPSRPSPVRQNATRMAFAAAVVLVALAGGVVLAGVVSGPASPAAAGATTTPASSVADSTSATFVTGGSSASPAASNVESPSAGASGSPTRSATPSPTRTAGPTPTPTHAAGPTPTPTPTATPTATPTPTPTATPTPTPTVTPLEVPTIACSANPSNGDTPYTVTCNITVGSSYQYQAGDELHWFMGVVDYGATQAWPDVTDLDAHPVKLEVHRTGTDPVSSNPVSCSAGVCS